AVPRVVPVVNLKPRPPARKDRWPDFELSQILAWADAHHKRTGEWPIKTSGFVHEAPREKWANIDAALRVGLRGLEGGSSLARLLDEQRGVRNRKNLPPYTVPQILSWADSYYKRNRRWPTRDAGPVEDAPGETWTAVEVALIHGH